MNKVINGKRYDTDAAQRVAYWDNDCAGDMSYVAERLYKKRTGEFFLHGEGGPSTKYREYTGPNSWHGGEKLIPLTDDEAREWAEQHLSADEYESIFGQTDESQADVMLSFKVDAATNAVFRAMAKDRGISLTDMLKDLIHSAQ